MININIVKMMVAGLILIAGLVAYYQLPSWLGPDVSILVRVAAVIASVVLAFVIAVTSSYGMAAIDFAKGSRIELRKMVWPTSSETTQTTIIVLILVVVVALFLWAVDVIVFNIIYDLLLGIDD